MTDHPRRVTRALLSVSDKSGLIEFARALVGHSVDLVSTGGTAKAIAAAGLKVTDVSELTGFLEMMDGRAKPLHPKVHGGLLAIRDNAEHAHAMKNHGIAPIDLLVVNLYPFEATVDKGAGFEECIENIDIGGPAMIRAAAKNHDDVAEADVVERTKLQRIEGACRESCRITIWAVRRGPSFPARNTLSSSSTLSSSASKVQTSRFGSRSMTPRASLNRLAFTDGCR